MPTYRLSQLGRLNVVLNFESRVQGSGTRWKFKHSRPWPIKTSAALLKRNDRYWGDRIEFEVTCRTVPTYLGTERHGVFDKIRTEELSRSFGLSGPSPRCHPKHLN